MAGLNIFKSFISLKIFQGNMFLIKSELDHLKKNLQKNYADFGSRSGAIIPESDPNRSKSSEADRIRVHNTARHILRTIGRQPLLMCLHLQYRYLPRD
jgi:hypothetical protein